MKSMLSIGAGLCALALAGVAQAAVLYGATSGAGPGELYILDPANGAIVTDIGPLNDATALSYGMTGLAFDPSTGILYGSSGNSGANPPASKAQFVSIDPATGLVTDIGPFNVGSGNTMTDLAFDPTTDTLYGVGSSGGPNLYSVNLTTGQATLVGSTGIGFTTGGGLAITPDGTVYGSPDGSRFGTYDKSTGAFTNIANPGPEPIGGGYGALSFDSDGTLYGANVNSTTTPHLVTINTSTAVTTDLGETVPRLDAIAFTVPEPASIGLLTIGLAGFTRRRRRN